MTKHWTEQNELKATFHRMAYMVFAKQGLVSFDRAKMQKPWEDEVYKNTLSVFRARYNENETESVADAIMLVKQWVQETAGKPQHAGDTIIVRVGVIRHYKDVSLEYALEATYHMEHLGTITQAVNELREIIDQQHEMAATNRPALMPQQENEYQHTTADILCTKVRHEFSDGKDVISLIGGEFQKYGIPVYPEFMERLGLSLEEIPMGDTEYGKVVRVQLDKNGKPKRAVEIVG